MTRRNPTQKPTDQRGSYKRCEQRSARSRKHMSVTTMGTCSCPAAQRTAGISDVSRHIIELLDRLSHVGDWNSSIDTVRHEIAGYDLTGFDGLQRTAAEDEIRRWREKRDSKVAQLKKNVSELSRTEIELIRRRYHPNKLRAELLAIRVVAPC